MTWWWDYVGLPFGDGPGAVTCWSLVQRVLKDQARIHLPDYGEISAADAVQVARTMSDRQGDPCWKPAEPGTLNVVLMTRPGVAGVGHVGICVNPQTMLHVERATASVLVPLDHFTIKRRICGFRRHIDLP